MNSIKVGTLRLGGGTRPFFIAGPCVIESETHCLRMADRLAEIGSRAGVHLIFKASFDKANRTSERLLSRTRAGRRVAHPRKSPRPKRASDPE